VHTKFTLYRKKLDTGKEHAKQVYITIKTVRTDHSEHAYVTVVAVLPSYHLRQSLVSECSIVRVSE